MKRPLSITLLAGAVFVLAAWQVWQVYATTQQLDLMRELGLETIALVHIVIGVTWALGLALAAWGLWRLRPWGRRWTLIAVPAFWLTVWVERLALQRAAYETLTRPMGLILTITAVGGVIGLLFLPRIRAIFHA